jgi:hypothetical protein
MADKPKPVLIFSAPPKPIDEMTNEEINQWAEAMYWALKKSWQSEPDCGSRRPNGKGA